MSPEPEHRPLAVWVVDDDESIRWVLEKSLKREGMLVRAFPGAVELLDALDDGPTPDVLLSDIRMPGIDGLALLERLRARAPELPVIIMTAHSDLDAAVASYKGGAFEYLPKPFDVDAAAALVRRAAAPALAAEVASRRPAAPGSGLAGGVGQAVASTGAARAPLMIGEAPAMQEVFRAIGRLAASNINVLVTGESGTGKELIARALHDTGPRASRPFLALNTAAIPRDLMESELFGHERGAFTGAATSRKGRFEQADGGTLFLDEIGDMPYDLQTRLLRVLQDGEFYRVGGATPVRVDVRVVAATHQNLERLVADGRFREDLYHRLNVIRVRIPPLRERRDDIPRLLDHFLARAGRELKTETRRAGAQALARLVAYDWPGNVRQLENVCRWLTVMAPAREITEDDLPPEVALATGLPGPEAAVAPGPALAPGRHAAVAPPPPAAAAPGPAPAPSPGSPAPAAAEAVAAPPAGPWTEGLAQWARLALAAGRDDLLAEALPAFEKALIEAALAATRGQRIEAARRLGWGRNTLTRKIQELGLDP